MQQKIVIIRGSFESEMQMCSLHKQAKNCVTMVKQTHTHTQISITVKMFDVRHFCPDSIHPMMLHSIVHHQMAAPPHSVEAKALAHLRFFLQHYCSPAKKFISQWQMVDKIKKKKNLNLYNRISSSQKSVFIFFLPILHFSLHFLNLMILKFGLHQVKTYETLNMAMAVWLFLYYLITQIKK